MSDTAGNSDNVVLLSDQPIEFQLQLRNNALASTAEGITISDRSQPDNPIVFINDGFERLTGYTSEDALGRNCRFLQGKDTDPVAVDEIRRAINEERPCSVELLNYRKDGTAFWNLLSITPIRDDGGKVTHFVGIQSDITARKEYERLISEVSEKLELTNRRLLQDLEDARQLQLAILPSKSPELPHLEISVAMETAQEVGGDYYDFFEDGDTMTFAIGDATGHGLKAGTIVTATKMLFNSMASLADPREILQKSSASLKEIGFRNMFMAMMIAKVTVRQVEIASAGMPFVYIYRKASGLVEEIQLKGMPLGSFPKYPYKSKKTVLQKGDVMLFRSDGLDECFNQKGEMFGEPRIAKILKEIATENAETIVYRLKKASSDWRGNEPLRDDMTLVVMKCTS